MCRFRRSRIPRRAQPARREGALGYTEDDVGVWAKAEPCPPLAWQCHARKRRLHAQQVAYHLKVQVRHPSTILFRRSKDANLLTPPDRGPNLNPEIRAQVPIQGVEGICFGLVTQHQDTAVIHRTVAVAARLHNRIHRGKHRGPCLPEEVHTQMDASPFSVSRQELLCAVDQSSLVIAPQTYGRTGMLHCVKNLARRYERIQVFPGPRS